MSRNRWAGLCAALCAAGAVQSSETVTYTYDVFGRMTNVQVSGGPANGVQRTYSYDAADNRTLVQVSGASDTGSITITPLGAVANITAAGVVIGVKISGSATPTGEVTFTENGVFLGSAFVYGGEASVDLEGFSIGNHTITVSYSGDGNNAPYSYAFTWQPADRGWPSCRTGRHSRHPL